MTATQVNVENLRSDIVDAASDRCATGFACIIATSELHLDETVGSGVLWIRPPVGMPVAANNSHQAERMMTECLWALGYRYSAQLMPGTVIERDVA